MYEIVRHKVVMMTFFNHGPLIFLLELKSVFIQDSYLTGTTRVRRSASLTLPFGHKQHYSKETKPMLTSDTEDSPLGCSCDNLVNKEMKTTSEQQEEADAMLVRARSIPFFKGKLAFNRADVGKYCIILHRVACEKKRLGQRIMAEGCDNQKKDGGDSGRLKN